MSVLADCADDVAAVQLRGRQKVERSGKKSDPCCAAHGMKKKIRGIGPVVKNWREKLENQRSAKHDFVLGGNGEAREETGGANNLSEGRGRHPRDEQGCG